MKDEKVLNFLLSYKMMSIVLIILCAALIGFNIYFVKSTKVYSFSGYASDCGVMDGTIYINHKFNRLSSPPIVYTGKDITFTSWEVGYYIEDRTISVLSSTDDTPISMTELIRVSNFSFQENHKNAMFFSKENVESIEKLEFRVSGETQDGNKYEFVVPLDVTLLT